jgi:hypothetical protein
MLLTIIITMDDISNAIEEVGGGLLIAMLWMTEKNANENL